MLFSLQSILEKLFFPVSIIIAALLYIRLLQPKKYFWLYIAGGLVVIAAFTVLANWLRNLFFDLFPMTEEYRTIDWLKYYLLTAAENLIVVLLITVTLKLSSSSPKAKVLFVMTAAYATQGICACFVNIVTAIAGEKSFLQAVSNNGVYAVLFAVYIGVYAACYFLLARRYNKTEQEFIDNKSLIVYVSIIVVNIVLGSVSSPATDSAKNLYLLLIISLLLCCVFVLFIQFMMYNWYVLKVNNLFQKDFIDRQAQTYAQLKSNIEFVDIKIHDLKHIISVLRSGGDNTVLDELEQTIKENSVMFNTENEALDVILTEKAKECLKKKIDFSVIADGKLLAGMMELDIYSLFCNALDNAIEANDKITGDSTKFISVNVRSSGEGVSIRIENSMQGSLKFSEGGLLETSKSDAIGHGFGSKSIHAVVNKYGGSMEISAENGVFNLQIQFPNKGTNLKSISGEIL